MADSTIQDKSLNMEQILERIKKWADTAKQYIGLGEVIIDRQPMQLLTTTPEGFEQLFLNEEQEQDIKTTLGESFTPEVEVKFNALSFDQEFREVIVLEQAIRNQSRRASIVATAGSLDRIARDTSKEFSRV